MRAPDRDLPTVVAELQRAIDAGRQPNLTAKELDLLITYIRKCKPDRRGHSMKHYIKGANRRMLRNSMEWIKIRLRHDPAERELKRATRATGGRYVLNRRVAEYMHKQLSGWKNIPSVKALENILNRSTANEPDVDPLWC